MIVFVTKVKENNLVKNRCSWTKTELGDLTFFTFLYFFHARLYQAVGEKIKHLTNLVRSMPLKLVASANHESEDQCQPLSANCFSNHPGVPMFQYFSFKNEILIF